MSAAALAASLSVITLLLLPTYASIIGIWNSSGTYVHGYLVPLGSAYFIWTRRDRVRALVPRASLLGCLITVLLGGSWLIARLAGVLVLEQYAAAGLWLSSVWAILGTQVVRALAFPLLFLLLAVPAGEILVVPLMNFATAFAVHALRLVGVPVAREGAFLNIPNGQWVISEACSGLRYLMASITFGLAYAFLRFRTFRNRFLFILLAAVFPIIVNGVRVTFVVTLGYLSDMKLAIGLDHFIYGWIFFGLMILVLFLIGGSWTERSEPEDGSVSRASVRPAGGSGGFPSVAMSVIIVLSSVLAWERVDSAIESAPRLGMAQLQAPEIPGWNRSEAIWDPGWRPDFRNATTELYQEYRANGAVAGLWIVYYRDQRQGHELINSLNRLVSTRHKRWRPLEPTLRRISDGSRTFTASESQIISEEVAFTVWDWYWAGGRPTLSGMSLKLLEIRSRLLRRPNDAALVVIGAPQGGQFQAPHQVLAGFARSAIGPIHSSLTDAWRSSAPNELPAKSESRM